MLRGKEKLALLRMLRSQTELERADWCREWLEDKLLLLPAHTNCSFYTDTDTDLTVSLDLHWTGV